ncbi:hypothetical protein NLJ89_g1001 [Agrocybe chaxingu]|uniref:Small secreted protein n=1 Tax=Agrocybe chaxingu TaxID=84603 RepID=A0A9W8TFX1_9AGAR|nr:hypothetical protein NLJ89_g1001 [Agrocybe chaxingu]
MARFSFLVASFALLSSMVSAAPVAIVRRQVNFPELPYAQFQISTTPGGTAAAEAAAIFFTPFNGVDLSTLDDLVEENIAAMRSAAEAAETDLFNPAIDNAASDAEADALDVGKTKNKVLKHTAFLQLFRIRLAKAQAAGESTADIEADITDREAKLKKNSDADVANAGKASQDVVGGAAQSGNTGNTNQTNETDDTDAGNTGASTGNTGTSNTGNTGNTGSRNTGNTGGASSANFQFPELPYVPPLRSVPDLVDPGGTAAEEAARIFLTPFQGLDLATLDDSVETNLAAMREAAEAAELDLFNPAIDAASGAEKDALEVGKTKNKVLKHTIFLQIFNIRLAKAEAAGEDTADIDARIVDRQNKLATNTRLDQANAGETSQAVA